MKKESSPEEIDGYAGQHMLCDGIHHGDWFWHVCHFGRVYNNVTGLKKSLRKYLWANNHSLVGCDLRTLNRCSSDSSVVT